LTAQNTNPLTLAGRCIYPPLVLNPSLFFSDEPLITVKPLFTNTILKGAGAYVE
jgi:hypothetical protein